MLRGVLIIGFMVSFGALLGAAEGPLQDTLPSALTQITHRKSSERLQAVKQLMDLGPLNHPAAIPASPP